MATPSRLAAISNSRSVRCWAEKCRWEMTHFALASIGCVPNFWGDWEIDDGMLVIVGICLWLKLNFIDIYPNLTFSS